MLGFGWGDDHRGAFLVADGEGEFAGESGFSPFVFRAAHRKDERSLPDFADQFSVTHLGLAQQPNGARVGGGVLGSGEQDDVRILARLNATASENQAGRRLVEGELDVAVEAML